MQGYYHRLAPFLSLFRKGLPILTYHKLGPRPRGVRLKGLYVSEKLFALQLAELSEAGFDTLSLTLLNPNLNLNPKTAEVLKPQITITFDDAFTNVLRFGLEPLARHGFRAIEFVVSDLIGKTNEWEQREGEKPEVLMDAAQLRDWLAAGHEIGSHTCAHPWLTRLPKAKARAEIADSKKKLEDLFGRPILHFCYPYGDWNETVRDLVAESGYQTACTTQPGVNLAGHSPFELKRFTARYPSRNVKAIWRRIRSGA